MAGFGKIAAIAVFADEADEIMRKTAAANGDNGYLFKTWQARGARAAIFPA
ncbi:MAG: hypothetical protein WAS54_04685 [Scrofimicrobium sp.]